MRNLSECNVKDIAELCSESKYSSHFFLEHYLDAISAKNEALHAYIEVFAGSARQRADELDRLVSQFGPVGPLHGVPIAVKDLACIEGRAPGFGSKCYRGTPAGPTALAIQRLIDAGAIIVGMTHMVEFAAGGWGTNYAVGTPMNPIDLNIHRVPGGSSSGSAVAVAGGLAPAAIGSDTGGSIRIPASLCGLVGFKPSFGLVPLEGIAPLSPSFDTLGPITRTVGDARLLFSVLSQCSESNVGIARPMRIGIPKIESLQPCDPEILVAFIRSVEALRSMGQSVETSEFPLEFSEYQSLNGRIVAYEAYRHHRTTVEDEATPMDPFVRQRILAGREIDDREYEALKTRLRDITTEFQSRLGHFDLLALPSTPLPAIPVSEVDDTAIPMSRYTRIGNCLGLCGISLPNGKTSHGLPTGFQLMSWSGQDALLLAFAEHVSSLGLR